VSQHATPTAWTLRRRLGQTFLFGSLVLMALVAVVVVSLMRFTSAGDDVIGRWLPAGMASARLLDDVTNQETALRGYALGANVDFTKAYTTLVGAENHDAAEVHRLAQGDSEVLSRLQAVTSAADAWRSEVIQPVMTAIAHGSRDATVILDSAASRQSIAKIRAAAQALVSVVTSRADASREARSRDRTLMIIALSVTAALLVAAGLGLWRGLHRWVLGPVDRLRAQTRLVAAGATRRQISPDGPDELATLGADVEAMRRQIAEQLTRAVETQDELQRRGAELTRSNADLQQFAYVASHDLSEPLRKVANFCQLLERQYGPELDDRARQYIDFAVDGARRMQVLIADLLTLSRVGRTTDTFVSVDVSAVVEQAEANLSYKMSEAGASVHYGRLPIVPGDPALIGSLIENLLANAIKYRRPDAAPEVTIAAEHDSASASWVFTFADNGIGIEPQYAERIFAVFQRLHLRDQYGGTGIGLAMCRKIVEFHGGRIWLDTTASEPGATFRFTLPEGGSHGQTPA